FLGFLFHSRELFRAHGLGAALGVAGVRAAGHSGLLTVGWSLLFGRVVGKTVYGLILVFRHVITPVPQSCSSLGVWTYNHRPWFCYQVSELLGFARLLASRSRRSRR